MVLCARKGPALGVRFPCRPYLAARVSVVRVHEHDRARALKVPWLLVSAQGTTSSHGSR